MNLIALFREANTMRPFVCGFDSYEIKEDCKHFTVQETSDLWPPYGRNFPGCTQDQSVNEYATDRQELHTCENCPFYKKDKNPINYRKLAEQSAKKDRRRSKKSKVKKEAAIAANHEETKDERKRRKQKERRLARKALAEEAATPKKKRKRKK